MNYEQINALTVENSIVDLLYKLRDFSILGEGEQHYYFVDDENETNYNNLVVPAAEVTKPTLQEFENELVVWKAELTAEEDARLAEIARKEDLTNRFNTIHSKDSGVPAFHQAALIVAETADTANAKKYIFDLINDISRSAEAETLMSQIEAKDVELTAAQAVQAVKSTRKALGRLARETCQDVLDVIAGWNMERSLTEQQITDLQVAFSDTEAALQANRPHQAKPLIEAITPDEVLITQEMKDEVLEVFSDSGLFV